MLQDLSCHLSCRQKCGTVSNVLLRAALSVALAGIVAVVDTAAAQAQTYGSDSGSFSKILQTIGLSKGADPDADINYTERSPLVVPPSRDLPPPAKDAAVPAPDWPTDPVKRPRNSKAKEAVVPDTAVQTPNPHIEKKPWYNPMGWFDREEYANFAGEPVRRNLTDPPAGYRIPSPEQPYGVNPNKTSGKKQASVTDFGMSPITPPAAGSGH